MKNKTLFECIECGYQGPKYFGKCPQCDSWNSMIETEPDKQEDLGEVPLQKPVRLDEIDELKVRRHITGLDEFDRVLGGGIVPHSIVLIGGEPGVGKSTLLMEISGIVAGSGKKVLYCSGEESAVQIKSRARRLGVDSKEILLLTMGNLEDLKAAVQEHRPDILIIDSIQTVGSRKGPGISGSIAAMRFVTSEIIETVKSKDATAFIVGHITKDGQIAGPKTLEHMVDVVLYFQGELKSDLRILRAEKNRFGAINEIGVFQMTRDGLTPIDDPSLIFLQDRKAAESGIAIFPTITGMRSILMEIQCLVSESPFAGNPRRIAVGYDGYRMSMLISIIEKKLKLPFYKSDVFLNIAGGMSIKEPAGDLAAVATLISSYKNIAVPKDLIIIGEVGLTGEVRPVSFIENRVKEAVRQGFTRFILPAAQADIREQIPEKITVEAVENLYEFYSRLK